MQRADSLKKEQTPAIIDMSTEEFINYLRDTDIQLSVKGDRLICNAPKDRLSAEMKADLVRRKDEIVTKLKEQSNEREDQTDLDIFHLPKIEPVSRSERLPLSFSQERLWFLHQLEPESIAYSMPGSIRLRGALDLKALKQTFEDLVHRHETLRTTFQVAEGQPEQVIAEESSVSLEVIDLDRFPESERETEALRLMEIASRKPFDLEVGPLFRVSLFRIGENSHVLHMNMHHIISDYWSFGVLRKEFAVLYTALSKGTSQHLHSLPIQYADFAYCQRQWMRGEVLEAHANYWKKKLWGGLATLDLPTDRPRPQVQTHHGATCSRDLPRTLVEELREVGREEGASLFMVLLAIFKVLLYRYSGQEDIIVGTPIAGRDQVQLEGLIGFFMNTVVMRTDISGRPIFRELLGRVRETAFEAYAHQMMPFEKLVEVLSPERDLSRTPIFQVFFNHIRVDEGRFELPGLEAKVIESIEHESKFDMTLYVWEKTEKVRLTALFNADLFDDERIQIMLEQFEFLSRLIIQNPNHDIADYALVTPSQNERLPDPSARLDSTRTKCVHQRFAEVALREPHRTAVADMWSHWSYGELDRCSCQLANLLCANGIGVGDTVAVYGHRSAGLVLALLGILRAGGVFVILDPNYPSGRLKMILEEADPAGWLQLEVAGPVAADLEACVAGDAVRFRLSIPHTKAAVAEVLGDISQPAAMPSVSNENTAYIVFTSGSTGTPKGIIGSHGPLSHFIDWHCREFGFTESDRFSMLSGLAHDPLLRDIFTPLWSGGTLCIPDPRIILMPAQLRQWMQEQGVTVAHMTPALGQVLTGGWDGTMGERKDPLSLRYVFFGGDRLTEEHVDNIRKVAPGVECINFYGATETPQAMGYLRIDPKALPKHSTPDGITGATIPLGCGIDAVQLLVMNSANRIAGIGEFGEIHVRTPYLAKGYLKDAKRTGELFIVNPYTKKVSDRLYKTGDMGSYLPNGQVAFHGRRDSQVSIRGFRVELKEIETLVARLPGVRDCAVLAKESDIKDRYLSLYVVAEQNQYFDVVNLRIKLGQFLPNYMIPTDIVRLDDMPLTPNGKIDYQKLYAVEAEPTSKALTDSPKTEMESNLADIWIEVLKLDNVSVHDNFFDVGGHSLLSIQVIDRIERMIGIRINPREFTYQTLGQMSAMLEDRLKERSNEKSNGKKSVLLNFFKKFAINRTE